MKNNYPDIIIEITNIRGNKMADVQGTLFKKEITFNNYSGVCKCGYEWEYKRSSIALEMFVPCPECGKYIEVGKRFD